MKALTFLCFLGEAVPPLPCLISLSIAPCGLNSKSESVGVPSILNSDVNLEPVTSDLTIVPFLISVTLIFGWSKNLII